MSPPAPTTRERIVAAAAKLFYSAGVRAVSVDAVAAKAGITKRSLYYHFASKDDLVAAYLDARDLPNIDQLRRWYDAGGATAAEKTRGLFRALAEAARRPNWKGCGFLRTAAELVETPGHPALKVGVAHKQRLEAWLRAEFTAAAQIDETAAAALARQILVLLDGAFASVLLLRDPSYIESAGDAAFILVAHAAPQRATPP